MALEIGKFYDRGSFFEGTISTRKLEDLGNVIFEPYDKAQDHEPDFLVKADRHQIGKAWKQTTRDGDREYLNVVLDDPHMDAQIRARLVRSGDHHLLLWERSE